MLNNEKVIELQKDALRRKYDKKLSTLEYKSLIRLKQEYSWEIIKVIPTDCISKKESDRHYRLLCVLDSEIDKESSDLKNLLPLKHFAIDVAEQEYVDMFGEFQEEYEND